MLYLLHRSFSQEQIIERKRSYGILIGPPWERFYMLFMIRPAHQSEKLTLSCTIVNLNSLSKQFFLFFSTC